MAKMRSQEQKLASIDQKIEYHEKHLLRLKEERELALNPPVRTRTRKTSMKKAVDALKEAGLTPDEILSLATKAMKSKSKADPK